MKKITAILAIIAVIVTFGGTFIGAHINDADCLEYCSKVTPQDYPAILECVQKCEELKDLNN